MSNIPASKQTVRATGSGDGTRAPAHGKTRRATQRVAGGAAAERSAPRPGERRVRGWRVVALNLIGGVRAAANQMRGECRVQVERCACQVAHSTHTHKVTRRQKALDARAVGARQQQRKRRLQRRRATTHHARAWCKSRVWPRKTPSRTENAAANSQSCSTSTVLHTRPLLAPDRATPTQFDDSFCSSVLGKIPTYYTNTNECCLSLCDY